VSGRARTLLWAMILGGVAARVIWAFATQGVAFDIEAWRRGEGAFGTERFEFYAEVNSLEGFYDWAYPPGYLAWTWVAARLNELTGLPFHGLVQLPAIAADAAIAWLVQAFLGRRGAGERTRLVAAGLVALGPTFAFDSGYHGQVNSLAILPALAAVMAWELRPPGDRRALMSGGLIGVGGAIKFPPLLMLAALLPSARWRREAFLVVGAAVAVPLLVTAPFLVATFSDTVRAFGYGGLSGLGGLSLLVRPAGAEIWLRTFDFELHGLAEVLDQVAVLVNLVWLVAACAFLYRYRPPPIAAALLLWLGFYVLGTGFTFGYLVWGLPFLLAAGLIREAALVQAAALVPTILLYAGPWESDVPIVVYAALMIALWAGFAVGLFAWARRLAAKPRCYPPAELSVRREK
jgi:uncharacterized membrane protein